MIHHGDCLTVMASMSDASVDAIVTDPPYGLSFMGKAWDHGVPGEPFWAEALRVAKPGAHLLAFGGTRTFHRLTCAIEDAGWEIRDCVMWVYGSGFPKSLDVSKAIDKAAGGLQHQSRGFNTAGGKEGFDAQDKSFRSDYGYQYAPATDAAKQWHGWGTSLKPAWEPIIVARKPLAGTVAANVLAHGTGAMNVDGCRVDAADGATTARKPSLVKDTAAPFGKGAAMGGNGSQLGRWPANLIHDGSEDVVGLFPALAGAMGAKDNRGRTHGFKDGRVSRRDDNWGEPIDVLGSAARFFYCAKASRSDRTEGGRVVNAHPTVKPTALMRYLCRLVTPPNGTILDPFCGSGSTGKAAALEGFRFIGIERDASSAQTAQERIDAQPPLLQEAAS